MKERINETLNLSPYFPFLLICGVLTPMGAGSVNEATNLAAITSQQVRVPRVEHAVSIYTYIYIVDTYIVFRMPLLMNASNHFPRRLLYLIGSTL